jgi:hypothetical protein
MWEWKWKSEDQVQVHSGQSSGAQVLKSSLFEVPTLVLSTVSVRHDPVRNGGLN